MYRSKNICRSLQTLCFPLQDVNVLYRCTFKYTTYTKNNKINKNNWLKVCEPWRICECFNIQVLLLLWCETNRGDAGKKGLLITPASFDKRKKKTKKEQHSRSFEWFQENYPVPWGLLLQHDVILERRLKQEMTKQRAFWQKFTATQCSKSQWLITGVVNNENFMRQSFWDGSDVHLRARLRDLCWRAANEATSSN